MDPVIQNIADSLENLGTSVINSFNSDALISAQYGWHHPSVNRHDLAGMATNLSKRLKEANINKLDESIVDSFSTIPSKIQSLQGVTVPQMFNGNGLQAIPAYMSTLSCIEKQLDPLFSWENILDNNAMPKALTRKLRSVQASIDGMIPDKKALEDQIALIGEATEAAENLPTDLQSLKEAHTAVQKISNEASLLRTDTENQHQIAIETVQKIGAQAETAEKLIAQCEEAYRTTTTKGLAGAFDQRAKWLSASMWIWVVGLLVSLAVAAWIGTHRIELLSNLTNAEDPKLSIIIMHLVLSLLSVTAPIWFAWLATKQISQRFKLAEDYGFKATVAKAYEGYRREAGRIDPVFEARLFSSALNRLDEAPLRLVNDMDHGSPWHELLASKEFQDALSKLPELHDKYINVAKDMISGAKSVVTKTNS